MNLLTIASPENQNILPNVVQWKKNLRIIIAFRLTVIPFEKLPKQDRKQSKDKCIPHTFVIDDESNNNFIL